MVGVPRWRQIVARVDGFVGPRADELVRGEAFAIASGLARRTQRDLRRVTERVSRRAWHLLNLPAGSDVNRLLAEIASLQRQVRDLDKRVGGAATVAEPARRARAVRHAVPS